jgi:signal transduction histidine kinase
MGYSVALLSKLDPSDPTCRDLNEIRKVAVKGAELTSRLLAFGRSQALRPEVLSPNTVIGDAEQMLHRLVGNEVRLTTKLDPSAGLVRLDSSSFHQVLMNLAVNARDAMPDGGELTISTLNVKVDMGSQLFPGLPAGEYVMIAVSDTGIGMSDEVRRHLFEPFFTTKEPGKGVGLGLSTVYGVVHQSGGQIFVDSEPGRGTTMRILFHRIFREAAPS